MGKGRKRLSGAKRREIKKKWKARTFLEMDSESSEDNGKMNVSNFTEQCPVHIAVVTEILVARTVDKEWVVKFKLKIWFQLCIFFYVFSGNGEVCVHQHCIN